MNTVEWKIVSTTRSVNVAFMAIYGSTIEVVSNPFVSAISSDVA